MVHQRMQSLALPCCRVGEMCTEGYQFRFSCQISHSWVTITEQLEILVSFHAALVEARARKE